MAEVVSQWQASVSDSMKAVLDAPIASSGGINGILEGGAFLGIAQNFSQSDLQGTVIDVIKVNAISLLLQQEQFFVSYDINVGECRDYPNTFCVYDNSIGNYEVYTLYRRNGDATEQTWDVIDPMINK
jgi:hypothetical protein